MVGLLLVGGLIAVMGAVLYLVGRSTGPADPPGTPPPAYGPEAADPADEVSPGGPGAP